MKLVGPGLGLPRSDGSRRAESPEPSTTEHVDGAVLRRSDLVGRLLDRLERSAADAVVWRTAAFAASTIAPVYGLAVEALA
jgi:hypothetical protein